jgi:hypothetical protein
MDEWIRAALTAATDKWHSRTGLLVALATVGGSLLVVFAGVDLAAVSRLEWSLVALALGLVATGWWRTHIPRVPTGRVGFAVALDMEESPDARQLREDFVHTLRTLLDQSHFRHPFTFVEVPAALSRRIVDEDTARSVCERGNFHFLLYGRARHRTLPQGPAHVIDIRGIVRHAPVPVEVSKQLGDDFGAVLPHRLLVGPRGDMLVCEFAASHVDAAARYVIGTAAALSNDFDYSEQLLLDAESRVRAFVERAEGAPLSALLDRVRGRLIDLYSEWLSRLLRRYTYRRDTAALVEAERVIEQLRRFDSNSYQAKLAAATCAFVLRRDCVKAREEIAACRQMGDAIWMYSAAFLDAYDGNLQAAYRTYQLAFTSSLADHTVPTQCEEFIQIVLDAEPSRYWLYFCLGLINQRAKGDLAAAKSDFERFLSQAEVPRFQPQVEASRKWIREIDAKLGSE